MFCDADTAVAQRVLASGQVNYWTGGEGRAFEKALCARFGARHALALANGTVALECALSALGIGAGDEVIVSPRSYFASVGCVLSVGATPVFADVDLNSQNIEPHTIVPALSSRTRAILPVHLAGWPCDMQGIGDIAVEHELVVVEDCAQAHGAMCRGQPVGSTSDAAAYSFCHDKIVTTAGEGGAVLTNRSDVHDVVWSLKEDGKSPEKSDAPQGENGFMYRRERIGSNYRLSEVQAAVGRSQLARLDEWLVTRRRWAHLYRAVLADVPGIRIPVPPAHAVHAYYQFYVFVETARNRASIRDDIVLRLREKGVPCSSGACPEIYRERPVREAGAGPSRPLPGAEKLGRSSIALPCHPGLTEAEITWIAEALGQAVRMAGTGPQNR